MELGIIQKSGSWFSYNGQKLAQGRDAAKAMILDNPELAEELEEKIMEGLKEQAKSPVKKGKGKASAKDKEDAPDSENDDNGASEPPDDENLDDVDFDAELNEDFTLEED